MSGVVLEVTVRDENTVSIKKDNGDLIVHQNPGDETPKDLLRLHLLRFQTVRIFESWLRQPVLKRGTTTGPELEVLGTNLYYMLFRGAVETTFREALKEQQTPQVRGDGDSNPAKPVGERLRLVLRFDLDNESAADWVNLPWEYLYCPGMGSTPGFFFSTHVDLVFARSVSWGNKPPPEMPVASESPLRVLVITSAFDEAKAVAIDAEKFIEDMCHPALTAPATAGASSLKATKFEICKTPTLLMFGNTLAEIGRRPIEERPHVVHFIGQGAISKDQDGIVYMLGSDVGSTPVSNKQFVDCFGHAHYRPQLIVLHLWESVDSSQADFVDLATKLMREGFPAVVATRYPISNRAAVSFCRAFYAALSEGEPVQIAAQTARWQITIDDGGYGSRGFAIPALYVNVQDGCLIRRATKPRSQDQPVQTPTGPGTFGLHPARPLPHSPPTSQVQPQASASIPHAARPPGEGASGFEESGAVRAGKAKLKELMSGRDDPSKEMLYKKWSLVKEAITGKNDKDVVEILERMRKEARDEVDDDLVDILNSMIGIAPPLR
jgi:hypothetical protein